MNTQIPTIGIRDPLGHDPLSPLAVAGVPHAATAGARPPFDALLQASRRVDWRFLLPEPNLGIVLYVGPAQSTLLDSLRLFSASVTAAEALPARGVQAARFHLLVAEQPAYETLQRAAGWLLPGGWLYLEVRRSPARERVAPSCQQPPGAGGPRLRHALEYVAAIRQLGFARVQAHWHWPNFESCAEIVPLEDETALAHALARRRSGTVARLKATVGRALLRGKLLARLVPCFSILAQKDNVEGP